MRDPLPEADPGPRLKPALVLGIGNPLRRDDGAGPAAAHRLAGRLPDEVEVRILDGEAAGLLEAWTGRARVILLDAVASGSPPGTLHRFEAASGPLPAAFSALSSHGFGAAEAIELSRVLGSLPESLLVYGVEGEDFSPGEGLTPAVAAAVERVVGEVEAEAELRSSSPG